MRKVSQTSAGLLAYRCRGEIEVLLAHPGGPYWAKKDAAAWSVPKGLAEPGADLLSTAQREFNEETNLVACGEYLPLTPVRQTNGKVVHVWAFEADFDLSNFASNTFEMEWPPKSGQRRQFPEVDRIAYYALPVAMAKILAYQRPLLHELSARLAKDR